jgi:hypothetical protein
MLTTSAHLCWGDPFQVKPLLNLKGQYHENVGEVWVWGASLVPN